MEQGFDPKIVVAVIGGLSGVATAIVVAVIGFYVQSRKLQQEFERDREGIRTEFMAEQVVRQLLEHKDHTKRKFKAIERRLGGYDENKDDLRRLLIRAGAVRFVGKSDTGEKNVEYWGLLSRNPDAFLVGKQRKARQSAAGTDGETDADDDAIIQTEESRPA